MACAYSHVIKGRSSLVCVCRGHMRVGATAKCIDGAHCAATELESLGTSRSGGYMGQRMSVHGAPPHDSYCTGRDGSCLRTHAAIASCVTGP